MANMSPALDEVNGIEGARETLVGDLNRASGSQRLSDGAPILADADIRYVVNFPDNTTLASKTGLDNRTTDFSRGEFSFGDFI